MTEFSIQDIATLATAVIGGGGATALIMAMIRRRPIQVRGELQIVESVLEVNDTLRGDVKHLLARVATLEAGQDQLRKENTALTIKVASLEDEINDLEVQNNALRERCNKLEAENTRLRGEA